MEDIIGKTIYAPTKTGNVKTWECHVSHNVNGVATLTIITRTKLDGKTITRDDVITEGKNLGKSNETTPFEQAISEAKSRYNKKQDHGYSLKIPTDISKASSNALGLPRPMLAHPINKVKVVEFPAWFQPKLDGHRALVTKRDGEMLMYSRQGKLITTMGHILKHLEDKVDEGVIFDGELYMHGEMLQNIGSFIKKARPESANIVYNVYDIIMDVSYTQRMAKLRIIFGNEVPGIDNTNPVVLVATSYVENMQDAQYLTENAITLGYEGGILRTPDKGYLAGFRSRQLLKIKKFDDSEHVIVDVVEGKDHVVNDVNLKVACFVCETPEGKRFDVTAHGDMYQKDRLWHEREQHIGKLVTIQHSGYTKEGKPWHPVCLRFREDI